MTVGATPKLTRSARESNWAPNLLSAPSQRAARPSSMSKTMAQNSAMTAPFHCSVRTKRIAVTPAPRPSKVSALGTTFMIDRSSKRSRRSSRRSRRSEAHWRGVNLSRNILPQTLSVEFCKNRLSGSDTLGLRQHDCTRRQVNIQPTAEADNAKALPPGYLLVRDEIAFDAPCDQPGNLYHSKVACRLSLFAPNTD